MLELIKINFILVFKNCWVKIKFIDMIFMKLMKILILIILLKYLLKVERRIYNWIIVLNDWEYYVLLVNVLLMFDKEVIDFIEIEIFILNF